MNLFDLKDRKVIVSTEALLIPEFKELWSRDKTKDKEKAIKELSYIYFSTDFKSPYVQSADIGFAARVVAKDFMKDPKYKPDKSIEEAIDKYIELQETPSMRLLKASLKTISNLTNYLETVNLHERDKNDRPIYKPNDVTSALKAIGPVIESLNKVKEQVEREVAQLATLRGQRIKGNREDP